VRECEGTFKGKGFKRFNLTLHGTLIILPPFPCIARVLDPELAGLKIKQIVTVWRWRIEASVLVCSIGSDIERCQPTSLVVYIEEELALVTSKKP
jgi:hypothetical protein